jgi:ribosomal protein S18 acetylase RimI-like enzyme
MIALKEVHTDKDFELARTLFREYASQLDVDLGFQDFEKELETINIQYARPGGVIVIGYSDEQPLGCFAIRPFKNSICELKRMYLKKESRGLGIGNQFLTWSVKMAKEMGYNKMRLDTLPTMQSAIKLYEKAGFYEIEPYRFNPIEGAKYFEIELNR